MTTAVIANPMEATLMPDKTNAISRKRLWTGRILTGLPAAFCVFDGVMKLFKPPVVVQAKVQLGYPESTINRIGIILPTCTLLYLIPRTSILGVVLLIGYLGGQSRPTFVHSSRYSTSFPR